MTNSFTIYSASTTPANSAINELVFGANGTSGTTVTTDSLTFGSGSDAGTITFTGGSGVELGTTSNTWAPGGSSTGVGGITTDYLAAVGSGKVTISFSSTQEYFGLLWGSINNGNTLTFYDGTTEVYSISYADLINAGGTSAQGSYYVAINIPGGYTSVVATGSSGSGSFEFSSISYAATTISDPTTGTGDPIVTPYDGSSPLCFMAGTMIATPTGEVAVETLQHGAIVTLADGGNATVLWLGRQTVSTVFADPLRVNPIRIKANALADGVPARDLLTSPDHGILVDGVLVQASTLVNGTSIIRETEVAKVFTYYHVEVADHALILAENTPAETFIDNVDRLAFDNWDEHKAILGETTIAEMAYPRAKAARQVPSSTRVRLAARAGNLYSTIIAA